MPKNFLVDSFPVVQMIPYKTLNLKLFYIKLLVFIIAEIGINHNGDIEIAKKLIKTAKSAGCDAILIHSKEKTPNEIFSFAKRFKKSKNFIPLVAVPSTYSKTYEKDLTKYGFKIVIYANHLLRSAYPAMVKTAESILQHERAYESEEFCLPTSDIIQLVRTDDDE